MGIYDDESWGRFLSSNQRFLFAALYPNLLVGIAWIGLFFMIGAPKDNPSGSPVTSLVWAVFIAIFIAIFSVTSVLDLSFA